MKYSDDPRATGPQLCVDVKPSETSPAEVDVVAEAVGLLIEAPSTEADEAEWALDAASRMRAHFRERLYGVYACHEEPEQDETTGVRPSWPGLR